MEGRPYSGELVQMFLNGYLPAFLSEQRGRRAVVKLGKALRVRGVSVRQIYDAILAAAPRKVVDRSLRTWTLVVAVGGRGAALVYRRAGARE